MYSVDYYEDENGKRPVEEFIDSLYLKMRVKILGRIALLEEYGPKLGMPFSRHLDDGIFELRTVCGNDAARILFFFVVGKRIILTHGFVKKTQRTPSREIKRAKKMRSDWRSRNE
ncbi:MAG: type II toxin-antitoxin system RelE/ParE family toxin [Eggerthellaceae bacterium]|nr:type II toxin-antitoxin system RelE/ParE family toxin [Eggerthellaceae bacterium]MDO5118134.1 type II toxin-antitoxin system RelE/ParE family toxin [Eggerthellaceae bacterium]